MDYTQLEDYLTSMNFDDRTIVLAVASFLGGQTILRNKGLASLTQDVKEDGSTVGQLDLASGETIARYVNASAINDVLFESEEKMPFDQPTTWEYAGLFDDLDGSINPMVGGVNMNFIGVGGVIHRKEDDAQVMVGAYLPFADQTAIFVAEKGKGTYKIIILKEDEGYSNERIILSKRTAQKNILIESGWMTENTLRAEMALNQGGFYRSLSPTTKDRVCGGIFQTVSGLVDSRQVVLNFASSHPADYCWLLLEEAGADVISQEGRAMHSESYAMLSVAPSFNGNKQELKGRFIEAMRSPLVDGKYKGLGPGQVELKKLCG